MKHTVLTIAVLGLLLSAIPTWAFEDATEPVVKGVELSLVAGGIGWGVGAYWPLYQVSQVKATVGPFVALGSKGLAVGGAARFDVRIPVVDNYVDLIAAGAAYHHRLSFEVWVGKIFELK